MLTRWGRAIGILAGLAAAVALAGCGSSPLSPLGRADGSDSTSLALTSSPPILTVSAESTASYTDLGTEAQLLPAIDGPLVATAWIDGNQGGKITCGRYTVMIPAGAFVGPATITVTEPDPTVLLCDLAIEPAAANHFKIPVQLTADVHDIKVDPSQLAIYWYDPLLGRWVNMFASSDRSSGTLTAYLTHFSRYATGKAGW
jgi:hypothetical protein